MKPTRPNPAATVLAGATHALAAVVFAGRSADDALERAAAPPEQRSAIRAVTLGSLRWYWRREALAATLIAGQKLSPPLRALLVVALHQLEYSRNPPEVTVSSAVDAARLLQQARAAGLINALLRRFLREREALLARSLQDAAAASAHPSWLLQALRAEWPQHWQQIIDANNEHPPMSLRLDRSRTTREAYLARLAAGGQGARALSWLPGAVVLDKPVAVSELPGFNEGWVSVQDPGAQLACALLAVRPGERVLDACAAPGGKTGALLEAVDGDIALTAVDIDGSRVQRIAQNLQRLHRQAHLVTADLREDPRWWDGEAFDRILVDAPCSATGVIRRHPDIKLLRRPDDVGALAPTQRRILEQCLRLLRPGGRLLYSTCSVLPAENERIVEAVLAAMPRARALPPPYSVPDGVSLPAELIERSTGMQLLPGNAAQSDGFYYACLTVT
ncbi:MAG: 16S rRNA (cytosine(967)-C(5))-methyltransferase RsmB [Steroidobacterales bacterium]